MSSSPAELSPAAAPALAEPAPDEPPARDATPHPAAATTPAAHAQPAGEPAVLVRDLGKCYEIYARPLDRLKQTLYRGRRQFYREFWALRGVSFEVARGEALGIIGRNGSGKSTLLQMVAGTLRPTEGQVEVRGRVHALLELGSGFNPEFTGRENVFLNGTVLGLTTRQIEERFDAIASFADIGEFLDQPIKTYSSGMVVRLAFAVQVQLVPDILIVDEALAVGDVAFQIKCITRMKRLLDSGVALLLVTHDANTVRSLCDRALWLDRGQTRAWGGPAEVSARYMEFLFAKDRPPAALVPESAPMPPDVDVTRNASTIPAACADEPGAPPAATRALQSLAERADLVRWGSGEVQVTGFALDAGQPDQTAVFEHGGRLHAEVEIVARDEVRGETLGLGISLRNPKGLDVITCTTWDAGVHLPALAAGMRVRVAMELENILVPGEYALVLAVEAVQGDERHYFDFVENAALIRVIGSRRFFSVVLPVVRYAVWPAQEPEN